MKSLLEIADFLYKKKKPNRFWNEGKLAEREKVLGVIDDILDSLELRDGRVRVNGVMLIGSVYDCSDKHFIRREPQDIDLYFWTNESLGWDTTLSVEQKLSKVKPFGLRIHPHIYSEFIYSNPHVDNIGGMYWLYCHPDLLQK